MTAVELVLKSMTNLITFIPVAFLFNSNRILNTIYFKSYYFLEQLLNKTPKI